MAQTLRPASHRIFMAVPPPAPVPTTIASYTLASKKSSLVLAGLGRDVPARWFTQVRVFRIVGMGTPRHLWPHNAQPGVADTFQANFRRVVTHDGVVPHHLKKCASAFRRGLEFRFVGKFLHQTVLLFRRTVHKLSPEFRAAARVHPIKPCKKSVLRIVSRCNGILGRANVAGCAHLHAVRNHEVNKLFHPGFSCSGAVILGNDHLGEVLHHPVMLGRKEQRSVPTRSGGGRGLGMILRASKDPSAEAGKRARYRGDSNVAENFPALYPLPAHLPPY